MTPALTYKLAQALEGARRDVDDVFASIRRDGRHRDIFVVEEHWIESRDFGDWTMAYVGDRNSAPVISPNLQLADTVASADGNVIALMQTMKIFLLSAEPRD